MQPPPSGAIPVNFEKLRSSWSEPAPFRLYYEDMPIVCKDCGTQEVWTAQQQQWWYEEAGGFVETTAVRCRACRKAKQAGAAKMQEIRLAGKNAKAVETARKLATERPDIFVLLAKPIQQLRLKNRIEKALLDQGIDTAGQLVACDPDVCPPQMNLSDWEDLKRIFKGFGIPIIGVPVLPP